MVRNRDKRKYKVVVITKPVEKESEPAWSEKYFLIFAFSVILVSTLIRTFDFSLKPPSYNGLIITRPYCGLHAWHFAHHAWNARNHVKYGLGYTRGYRTSAVGNPPPANPQRYVSHPPLDTLITAFGMLILGTREWGIRLFDLLLSIPVLLLILLILKKLYGSSFALVSGLLLVVMPIFAFFAFELLVVLMGLWALYRHLILTGRLQVSCYRGSERIASFTVYLASIVTSDKNDFKYPPGMPDLAILAPPEVKPLEARWNCACNLNKLLSNGLEYRSGRVYPDPNRWCDDIVAFLRSRHVSYTYLKDDPEYLCSDASIARLFACPSVHVSTVASDARANLAKQNVLIWRSDYAMNPHCLKESPKDTVFLFESKPGWNQYGGPELFTFDNHDPKGGCVLLNDGTVKFIRTKEELQQLRWK